MSAYVVNLLKSRGPCLTSDLIQVMIDEGVSPAAARQRLSRAKSSYTKLAGIQFEKRARFIYLDSQFATQDYWEGLERAFREHGMSYWCAIAGLRSRGGACLKSQFPIVCGAPLMRKGQIAPDTILERLQAAGVLKEIAEENFSEPVVTLNPMNFGVVETSDLRAFNVAENVAIHAIHEWARRVGLGSYGAFRLRNVSELPVVSSVAWDITAPSYARPLARFSNGQMKPGFIVSDVVLGDGLSVEAVEVFIRKHDMASAPLGVAPIMPFLVANWFDQEAYDAARSAGVIAVTVEQLLGKTLATALQALVQILSDLGATAAVNAEKIEMVLNELTRIEGAAQNLRGDLFELVIGNVVKAVEKGSLSVGREIQHRTQALKAELDVRLNSEDCNNTLIIECKAKVPGSKVSEAEVRKWYEKKILRIVEILRSDPYYSERRLRFEMWTNGLFHPTALAWLDSRKTEFEDEGYSVGWRDGVAVKKYSKKVRDKAIQNILREHYFNHPLTKIATEE
ncbi:MAG: hypothetical protein ABJM11_16270 [Marinobacter sp.]|jgi:hypothetical protein|uniref:hypothetical protein n=1 Tax=Marinobacter TaxID=2742 RepID=UPI00241BF4FC|nr:hypothetical protein [Marinobacter nauticus]